MKRFTKKNRKARDPKTSRKRAVPKPTEFDTQTDYVGYNVPPAEAERIQQDLEENRKESTNEESPSPDFSKEDIPERTDGDPAAESTDDRGLAEK